MSNNKDNDTLENFLSNVAGQPHNQWSVYWLGHHVNLPIIINWNVPERQYEHCNIAQNALETIKHFLCHFHLIINDSSAPKHFDSLKSLRQCLQLLSLLYLGLFELSGNHTLVPQ